MTQLKHVRDMFGPGIRNFLDFAMFFDEGCSPSYFFLAAFFVAFLAAFF